MQCMQCTLLCMPGMYCMGSGIIIYFNYTCMCFEAPARLMKTPVPSMTRSTPISPQGNFVGSRLDTTLISLPSTLICSSSMVFTSALKTPRMVSYFRRWLACLTPPESLIATISRLVCSRPCQQRRKLRPIRPKPLIPTLIFFSETVTCLWPTAPCAIEKGVEQRHWWSYCCSSSNSDLTA